MDHPRLPVKTTLSALRCSIYDGIFANIFGNFTGGIFLPAFALALGAGPLEMGLISAIPLVSVIGQFGGAYLAEKLNRAKQLVIYSALLGRNLWVLFIPVSMVYSAVQPEKVLITLLIMLVFFHLLGAVTGVSWLSWMSGLVPDDIRGRYFGLRNSIIGATTIFLTFFGGRFLDWFPKAFPGVNQFHSFHLLFGLAVIAGLISIYFVNKQPDLKSPYRSALSGSSLFRQPLAEPNFARLLRFGAVWSFAMNLAVPFFIVYMIRDLKLSYTLVAFYTIIASFADLVGMRFWGFISDRTGNKPIIAITSVVRVIFPFIWLFTTTDSISIYLLIPALHIFGGFFGAGYNLCAANLVFRLAPVKNNAIFFGFWSGLTVVATGAAALLGGILAEFTTGLVSENTVFLDSTFKFAFFGAFLCRLAALYFLRGIREPKGMAVVKTVRVLSNRRFWATVVGFHPAFLFFLPGKQPEKSGSPYWPIWKT